MEKLIQQYMEKLGISREDAIQLIEDDKADYIGEEGEQMTQQAKALRRYEKAEEQKPRKPREKKIDPEKVEILDYIMGALVGRHVLIEENEWDFSVVTMANPQKEITFAVGENEYSLTLTRHRKKGT